MAEIAPASDSTTENLMAEAQACLTNEAADLKPLRRALDDTAASLRTAERHFRGFARRKARNPDLRRAGPITVLLGATDLAISSHANWTRLSLAIQHTNRKRIEAWRVRLFQNLQQMQMFHDLLSSWARNPASDTPDGTDALLARYQARIAELDGLVRDLLTLEASLVEAGQALADGIVRIAQDRDRAAIEACAGNVLAKTRDAATMLSNLARRLPAGGRRPRRTESPRRPETAAAF